VTVSAREPVRVLQSFPEPRPTTNPYVVQLRHALDELDDVRQQTFSWSRALFGGYDVFHVHWPEILVSGRDRARRLIRRLLFLAFVARLWARGTAVVRTMHNVRPHAGLSRVDRWLLGFLDRRTALVVRLNEETAVRPGTPCATILHGHYRDWFAHQPRPEREPRRAVFVGLVRPYKNVEALVRAFADVAPSRTATLHVAGEPSDTALGAAIEAAARGVPGVSLDLRFLDDRELVHAVSTAQVVVLPYREMHNSGVALMALSLDRPVLVPDNDVTARLAEEVGPEWVLRYSGDLTGEALGTALDQSQRIPRGARPDLGRREWQKTGSDHLRAYRRAQARPSPRRRPASQRRE
jgi:beta-1,4-mannosyltransferase